MKGYVSLWYEHLRKNRVREAKSKIKTWSKINKYMDKKFLPSSYKQELYLKIISLGQENLKVKEYIREFKQLQMRVSLNEELELKIFRFVKGIYVSIANKVDL